MQKGLSTLEAVFAIALFGIVVSGLGSWLFGAQEAYVFSGEQVRAAMIAEEGLEAVRSMRDASYASLSAGTHGLTKTSGTWAFSGSSDSIEDYTRVITVSNVDATRKRVSSEVSWVKKATITDAVTTVTYFTKWLATGPPPGSCTTYCQSLSIYTLGTCRANAAQCTINAETYQSGGDVFCTGGPSADTCCCAP
jgi:Tfp pilus assembly protein PilV